MAQDIRKMFQQDQPSGGEQPEQGHQERFRARLEQAFPKEQKSTGNRYYYSRIAAVLVVALAVALFYFRDQATSTQVVDTAEPAVERSYQLSDVSPEFKKVEDFYLASLNLELAKLEVTEENKELIDSFMAQLAELDKEYQRLNLEIQEHGLNQNSLEAMISNLQLRLELLYKLKNKIKDINQENNRSYENLQV